MDLDNLGLIPETRSPYHLCLVIPRTVLTERN